MADDTLELLEHAKRHKGFDDDEVVMAEYACSYHGKLDQHGTLYVSQRQFMFEPSFFAGGSKSIPLSSVQRITRGKLGSLTVETERRLYEFRGFADSSNAYDIMHGAHRTSRIRAKPRARARLTGVFRRVTVAQGVDEASLNDSLRLRRGTVTGLSLSGKMVRSHLSDEDVSGRAGSLLCSLVGFVGSLSISRRS